MGRDIGFERRGKLRRYRVAVYCVCGSASDVDRVFDRLIETVLSERREEYFWGVILDHAPSPLFRAFGDGEIEARVRKRFKELCDRYPECGFFSFLRGRRYFGKGGKRYFRCEGGLYGAVRMLGDGREDGFTLRLSTGDTVEHGGRIFIRDERGGASDGSGFFPGDITRSSFLGGSVSVCRSEWGEIGERRRFMRGVFGENSGNYRVFGWVSLDITPRDTVGIYRVLPCLSLVSSSRNTVFERSYTERIVLCAERGFVSFPDGSQWDETVVEEDVEIAENRRMDCGCGFSGCEVNGGGRTVADRSAWELVSALSLAALGRIDAVNLRKRVEDLLGRISFSLVEESPCEAGFLRVVLLVTAAFCDTLGVCGEAFYTIASRAWDMAEGLRLEYELVGGKALAYFMPCETVAFRPREADADNFCGFPPIRRLSDCFLYLFCEDITAVRRLLVALVSHGFGRYGVIGREGYCRYSSALLLAVCAEAENRVFSRMVAMIPEIKASFGVIRALPPVCDTVIFE